MMADMPVTFAAANLHIDIKAESIFHIGEFPVTNSMLMGAFGYALVIWLFFAAKIKVGSKQFTKSLKKKKKVILQVRLLGFLKCFTVQFARLSRMIK